MTLELFLFFTLALIALLTAWGMISSKNAVYAALNLVTNFLSVAILYLLLDAPFIALAQVTVYAGAIMVLFLFVIMLLGTETLRAEFDWKKIWFQAALALALLVEGFVMIFQRMGQAAALPINAASVLTNPSEMAKVLFTDYLLPFELTSILLLVAMIGAIVLTKQVKKRSL